MGFLETIAKAKAFLREHGRVSLRALQREFGLVDDALAELVEEVGGPQPRRLPSWRELAGLRTAIQERTR